MIIKSLLYFYISFLLQGKKLRDLGTIIENQINKYLLSTYYVCNTLQIGIVRNTSLNRVLAFE